MKEIVFYIIAAVTLLSGLMVVTLRNIVHSALYMVVTFIGVAGLYILLEADFLAAVQILVYAGAIAIFIVFGIMLTQRGNMKQTNLFSRQAGAAAVVALALFALMFFVIPGTEWASVEGKVPANTVKAIAEQMLGTYVVPFEVAAVLLTVAMLGAIIIAKGVNNKQ